MAAASSSATKKPPSQFFDIIVQPLNQGIRIPVLFMRRYGNCLKDAVFLNVPDGIQWKVELQVINGDTWMKKGFQEFAEFYCLKKYNLLVFKYEGNFHFSVSLFDITTAEIDYSFKLHPEFRPVKPQDPEYEPVTVKSEDVDEDTQGSNSVYETSDDSVYEVSDHESGRRREKRSRNVGISYTFVNGRRLRKRVDRKDSDCFLDESSEGGGKGSSDVLGKDETRPCESSQNIFRRSALLAGSSAGEGASKALGKDGTEPCESSRNIFRPTALLAGSSAVEGSSQALGKDGIEPCESSRNIIRPSVLLAGNSAGEGASKALGKDEIKPCESNWNIFRPALLAGSCAGEGASKVEKLKDCERNFKSEYPFFACSLNHSSVSPPNYEVTMPTHFFRENFAAKLFKEEVKELSFNIRVHGQKNMLPVTICKRRKTGRFRGRGWKQLVMENALKVGEVCIFELVVEEKVFNLHKCG